MTYLLLISLFGVIGIIGAVFIVKDSDWHLGRMVLPSLAILFLFTGLSEYFASLDVFITIRSFWIRTSIAFQIAIAMLLLELTVSFLGKEGIRSPFTYKSKPIRLRLIWRPFACLAVVASAVTPWFSVSDNESSAITLTFLGEVLFASVFSYHLLTLYIVEKIFRTSNAIQKRIFTQYLLSTGIIALGSIVLLVRILFFKTVSLENIQIHAALCSIFFPGILIGLTRYRLWQEQIMIGRGIVYTSFTILFFGIFLVILGIIASAVRLLGINFDEFEGFIIIFSLVFIGILIFFSPHMRKTITALSKKYIYKSKYDYRDQLLRLHNAHQASGNIHQTINAFIDNLHYTIIVKKAYIFLRSVNENSFMLFGEAATGNNTEYFFKANSLLIELFENNSVSSIDINHKNNNTVSTALDNDRKVLEKLSLSHLFAIKYKKNLIGILGVNTGAHVFDSEDLMLISMFCESIGTAIYRDRILSEHVEQKQFESFNHMASFIVHDIKNQVATLSLVTKNAKSNISNPDFHPTLLRSLENCSFNLNLLIEKLKSPPHKGQLVIKPVDCTAIVKKTVNQTRDTLPQGINIHECLKPLPCVNIDESALHYILKNLIINALEALGQKGEISFTTGPLDSFVHDDTYHFSLTPADRENHQVFIIVEDNGPGMSRKFVENKLFRPFNTTKDKGIGLGLYQCKTLIEAMGGRLLCWSEEGKGTRFCILL